MRTEKTLWTFAAICAIALLLAPFTPRTMWFYDGPHLVRRRLAAATRHRSGARGRDGGRGVRSRRHCGLPDRAGARPPSFTVVAIAGAVYAIALAVSGLAPGDGER